ncbi:MAG: SAM-dependent methyltransferase [Muribaculaceae bacterium]|nr:SAM-dependent methyltransferase [Muribaculaceae bacterium]
MLEPALYLLPSALSEADVDEVIPARNRLITSKLRYFVVENLRTARRWIKRCDRSFSFEGVEMVELNKQTPESEISQMLEPLRQGHPMGVMSEAGCPAVADPGAALVNIAQKEGLKVVPLVGPSSIIMSLMASGMNGQNFAFLGYLPIDEKERRNELRRLERESEEKDRTQIFIETPYRNNKMVEILAETLQPDTLVCVAADITDGERESIVTLPASQWRKRKYDYSKRPVIYLIYRGMGEVAKKRGRRR